MTSEMNEIILGQLAEIEEKENVKILHCVESGSRAWGFASPDSDYDVRFIYLRKPEFYLKLEKTSDVIDWCLDETLDINGWDLQKTLRLLCKSNPTVFEWNNSPIVYKTTPEWAALNDTVNRHFIVKTGIYHYLNTARSTYNKFLISDEVKLKKYFYALRPLLACQWIFDRGTPPPVLFSELTAAQLQPEMREVVEMLVEIKKQTPEFGTGKRIEVINSYIEAQMAEISERLSAYPSEPKRGWEELDREFLNLARGCSVLQTE